MNLNKLGITPTPWVLKKYSNDPFETYKEDERCELQWEDEQNICDCIYTKADGLLFFNAPEMLEALINVGLENTDYTERHNKCREAAEKATGKSWEEIKELTHE